MEFWRVLSVFTGLFLALPGGLVLAQDNPWKIGRPSEFRQNNPGSGQARQDERPVGRFAPENYSAKRGYWQESGRQGSLTNERNGNEKPYEYGMPRANNTRDGVRGRDRDHGYSGQQGVAGSYAPGGYNPGQEYARSSGSGSSFRSTGEFIPNSGRARATDPMHQQLPNNGRIYGEFPPLDRGAGKLRGQISERDNTRYSDNRGSSRPALPPNVYPPGYGGYYPGTVIPGMPGPSTFSNPYGGVGGIYLNPYGHGFPGAW